MNFYHISFFKKEVEQDAIILITHFSSLSHLEKSHMNLTFSEQ